MNSACLYKIPLSWEAINKTVTEDKEDLEEAKSETIVSLRRTEKCQKITTAIAIGLALGLTLALYAKGQGTHEAFKQNVFMFGAIPVGIGLGGVAFLIYSLFGARIARFELRLE